MREITSRISPYILKRISPLFACKTCRICPAPPTKKGSISDRRLASQRHGSFTPTCSHEAASIALDCGWTEVSLSPCTGHRAPAATQVSGADVSRSVCHWRRIRKFSTNIFCDNLIRLTAAGIRPNSDKCRRTRLGAVLLSLSTLRAAQGKVSEILLFNCQGTRERNLPSHNIRK